MEIVKCFSHLKSGKPGEEQYPELIRNLLDRRDLLKAGAAVLLAGVPVARSIPALLAQARQSKKVIVGGGGIAGLSCAYELMKRGHDVTLLEAGGRAGGHVKTIHDPFPNGLYADVGAEHCWFPGYTLYKQYVEEFNLTLLPYPRRHNVLRFLGGKMYTEDDLHNRSVLSGLGFNKREISYLAEKPWSNIPLIYVQRYVDKIEREDTPFGWGLDDLDRMSLTDLLKKEGASTAVTLYGGSIGSALEYIWNAAEKRLRGAPSEDRDVFRIKGGNQLMTDAFATRLGKRVRLGCPVEGIEHGASGVTVTYREFGQKKKKMEADYLICCMSALMLGQIPVTPPWPEDKDYVIHNMPYYTVARVVFQSRTKFWERDGVSPNMEFDGPTLHDCWQMAGDVETRRGILIGTVGLGTSTEEALATFRKYYPGKSEDIEQVVIVNWATNPWAMGCERINYPPGELHRFWPRVTEPCGRIYFAGAYAANIPWGQEAALESANRAARAVDAA